MKMSEKKQERKKWYILPQVAIRILIIGILTSVLQPLLGAPPLLGIQNSEYVQQQKSFIKGTVRDSSGEPLSGVSVVVDGTSIGTSTDIDGHFEIDVINIHENSELVFSYIGFKTIKKKIGKLKNINVVLLEDMELLDEVVVVGYGSLKKTDVSTSIASLKSKDFNLGGSQDPLSVLEGRIAGFSVTRTNGVDPNSSVSMQLRGVTSLKGSAEPLVVIDGMPSANMDLLQANDIESIEVLKDGSAAAIYGSKANAGVILITTKSGKKGKTKIEFSSALTKHFIARSPEFLTASEYRTYKNDPNNVKGGQMVDYGYSTDFFDAILDKDNLSQSYDLAVSGGSEKMNYRASVFYNNYQGIDIHNDRKKYGARFSLNTKGWNDMLSFQMNAATSFVDADLLRGMWENALMRNPTSPIRNEDGTFFEMEKETNPVGYFEQQSYFRDQSSTSVGSKVILSPIKDLVLRDLV